MTRIALLPFLRSAFGPAFGLLAAASVGIGLFGALSPFVSLPLAIGGATGASLFRAFVRPGVRFLGLVPALVSLGVLVTYCPVGPLPELAAGIGALALLLWCSEDPERVPGTLGRGFAGLAAPGAVFGLALASSLLLPAGVGSLGIAAAPLLGSVAAVALLLAAPQAFDRDPSVTS